MVLMGYACWAHNWTPVKPTWRVAEPFFISIYWSLPAGLRATMAFWAKNDSLRIEKIHSVVNFRSENLTFKPNEMSFRSFLNFVVTTFPVSKSKFSTGSNVMWENVTSVFEVSVSKRKWRCIEKLFQFQYLSFQSGIMLYGKTSLSFRKFSLRPEVTSHRKYIVSNRKLRLFKPEVMFSKMKWLPSDYRGFHTGSDVFTCDATSGRKLRFKKTAADDGRGANWKKKNAFIVFQRTGGGLEISLSAAIL